MQNNLDHCQASHNYLPQHLPPLIKSAHYSRMLLCVFVDYGEMLQSSLLKLGASFFAATYVLKVHTVYIYPYIGRNIDFPSHPP